MAGFSVVVGLLLLSTLIGWSLWLGLSLAGVHAALRDATPLIEAAELADNRLQGDMDPFLNV